MPAALPVWLLDIDGVINANNPGWGAAPRRVSVAGYMIRWAPALIDRIRNLRATGAVEIRWSSTWCKNTFELADLARHLRMPDLDSAFTTRPEHLTWAELKFNAARGVLAEGRRLVWTDDDEVEAARKVCPDLVAAEAAGTALLIAPKSNRGLQPEDLDLIEDFTTNLQQAA
jgi:hypothetical protein